MVQAVLDDWRTAPVNESMRAMLGFLEKLTLRPAQTTTDDIAALRQIGIPDRAIEEALYVCFMFNVIDRLADAFAFDLFTAEGYASSGRWLAEHGYRYSSIPG